MSKSAELQEEQLAAKPSTEEGQKFISSSNADSTGDAHALKN